MLFLDAIFVCIRKSPNLVKGFKSLLGSKQCILSIWLEEIAGWIHVYCKLNTFWSLQEKRVIVKQVPQSQLEALCRFARCQLRFVLQLFWQQFNSDLVRWRDAGASLQFNLKPPENHVFTVLYYMSNTRWSLSTVCQNSFTILPTSAGEVIHKRSSPPAC